MNGRKARFLRRAAEQATVGKPKVAYRQKKTRSVRRKGATMIVLTPDCTRYRYQRFKALHLAMMRA